MKYFVFYHSPCNDGELCMEIWKNKYSDSILNPWDHINVEKNINLLNNVSIDNTIVFLDYCPKSEYIKDLTNKIIIIDHHENACTNIDITNNIELIYNPNKSGCMLVWEYLYNNTLYPITIYHVGNNDIFNFDDPETEPFVLAYKDFNIDYFKLCKNSDIYCDIINKGKDIINKFKVEAEKCFNYIEEEKMDNINILTIKCNNYKLIKYLLEFAQSNYNNFNVLRIKQYRKDKHCYSLRSIDGKTKVDSIARLYGGNGHPYAAGYSINIM